ncbi:hypothetical protein AAGW05_00120 [Arthrobacter sp. LAPM80]|uniref:hypothetical protein n=1 Tax=Arthrobacter sp. LAPM80 TaxID=3141788 RepID=UPI00398A589D
MVQQEPTPGMFAHGSRVRGVLVRVPVSTWRLLMHPLSKGELERFNANPIEDVRYFHDIDFVGDRIRPDRLDVIVPNDSNPGSLPVYVYFHGGGWTSRDKASLRKYCARRTAGFRHSSRLPRSARNSPRTTG